MLVLRIIALEAVDMFTASDVRMTICIASVLPLLQNICSEYSYALRPCVVKILSTVSPGEKRVIFLLFFLC